MRWEKLGCIFAPDAAYTWARSHAYIPTPHVAEERIRVYAAFLDDARVGRIGYVDVAADDPRRVLAVSEHPVLDTGEPGAFDDNGVTPATLLERGDELWLYYFGWQTGVRVPYFVYSGLAISADGGSSFVRHVRVPVLDRVDGELVCRSAPSVLPSEHGWDVWYVAGDRWTQIDGKIVPTYDIRHSTSRDGVVWTAPGQPALSRRDDEYGLGRPFVVRAADGYRMWYSVRSRSRGYRLGFAVSSDGAAWTRCDDDVGIDVSETGWDSEMICFGAVVEAAGRTYLFYNGNDYGRTGFGAAVLVEA